ncbi:hypothetical protein NL676_036902 [Syzygium grande]|nr:hypothetical protein NL676_036902 [Syzygium grande]
MFDSNAVPQTAIVSGFFISFSSEYLTVMAVPLFPNRIQPPGCDDPFHPTDPASSWPTARWRDGEGWTPAIDSIQVRPGTGGRGRPSQELAALAATASRSSAPKGSDRVHGHSGRPRAVSHACGAQRFLLNIPNCTQPDDAPPEHRPLTMTISTDGHHGHMWLHRRPRRSPHACTNYAPFRIISVRHGAGLSYLRSATAPRFVILTVACGDDDRLSLSNR